MEHRKLQSNIWKLYAIKGINMFMIAIPIIVLFFQENGLSMGEIFLLQSLFSLSIIIFEVPTGYFSDVFGRKNSLVAGAILSTIGFAFYTQSSGFWSFLFAEIILGIGSSFISGSDTALLYDTLILLDKKSAYKGIEGRRFGLGLFLESMASILGGILALVSLRLPLYCDALVAAIAIPIVFSLIDPKIDFVQKNTKVQKGMWKMCEELFADNKVVTGFIMYSSVVGSATLTMFWLTQIYLSEIGIAVGYFGVILALFLILAAVCSWYAEKIEKFLGKRNALIMLIVLPTIGFVALAYFQFIWSWVFILIFYVVRGINNPVILDHINGRISSDMRATILSIKSLINRLVFSVVGPFIGWINDLISLKVALLFSAVIFFVLGIMSLTYLRKHKAL